MTDFIEYLKYFGIDFDQLPKLVTITTRCYSDGSDNLYINDVLVCGGDHPYIGDYQTNGDLINLLKDHLLKYDRGVTFKKDRVCNVEYELFKQKMNSIAKYIKVSERMDQWVIAPDFNVYCSDFESAYYYKMENKTINAKSLDELVAKLKDAIWVRSKWHQQQAVELMEMLHEID